MNETYRAIGYNARLTAALDGYPPPNRQSVRRAIKALPAQIRRQVFGVWRDRGR